MSALEDFESDEAPPATQIRRANSPADRATILLRLPDAILLALAEDLKVACEDCQFDWACGSSARASYPSTPFAIVQG